MTPDFCSPILYKIRQGASDSATLLVVISDATQNTDKKTSKIVYFILAEVLNVSADTYPLLDGRVYSYNVRDAENGSNCTLHVGVIDGQKKII